MKLHLSLPLLLAVLASFGMASASITSTVSGDTQTIKGTQDGKSADDYDIFSKISTDDKVTNLVFSSVQVGKYSWLHDWHGAYFTAATISQNVRFDGTGLTLIKGVDSATTTFTGSISGTGNFTQSSNKQSSTSQDFVFTGDMTSYSGSMSLETAVFSNGQSALNGTSEGILQFGQNTVAQGTVLGEEGNRTITNVTGSGAITTTGVLRFLYTAHADAYDYLTVSNAITARYVTIGGVAVEGGSTDASYVFAGTLTGKNSTASNNTLVVNADTVFQAAVSKFGTITVNKVATFNSTLSDAKVTINDGATLKLNTAETYSFSNTLLGSGFFEKMGSGTLTITSSNTGFEGKTILSEGTVEVGAEKALGTGAVNLASGATLVLNTTKSFTFSNVLSGAGSLNHTGSGTVTINSTNTEYTGTTSISKGTLVVSAEKALGTGAVSLASGATLALNTSDSYTFSNVLSGAGSLNHTGSGTVTINSTNTEYTGKTTISKGTLVVGAEKALGTGAVSLASGATLALNSTSLYEFSNVLSGAGSLIKTGIGTVTINAINTNYTGTTSVNEGTLVVKSSNALGSGAVNLERNTSLALDTSDSYTFSNVFSGSGSLCKIGSGTVTINKANTNYTGKTIVSEGTLVVGTENALGAGTIKVVSGATLAFGDTVTSGGFANNVDVDGSLSFGSGSYTVSGVISGAGSLVFKGGSLSIEGDNGENTFEGGTIIESGTLTANKAHALGTGDVTINKGTLTIAAENGVNGNTVMMKGGILNAAADNALKGAQVTVSGGTVNIGYNKQVNASSVTIAGGTVDANGNKSLGNNLTITSGTLKNLGLGGSSNIVAIDGASFSDGLKPAVSDLSKVTVALASDGEGVLLENVQCELISGEAGKTITIGSGQSLTVSGSDSQTMLTFNDVTSSFFTLNTGATLSLEGTLVLNIGSLQPNAEASWIYTLKFADISTGGTIDLSSVTNIIVQKGDEELYNWSGSELSAVKNSLATTGTLTFTIPEPSTATLSLLALAGLLERRRRCA